MTFQCSDKSINHVCTYLRKHRKIIGDDVMTTVDRDRATASRVERVTRRLAGVKRRLTGGRHLNTQQAVMQAENQNM